MKNYLTIAAVALGFFLSVGTADAAYFSYPCATLACGGYDSPYYNQPLQGWNYGGFGGYGSYPSYGDYNYGAYAPNYGGYYPQQQWGGYGGGGATSYANSGIGSYNYGAPQIMTGGYGNNYASPYMAAALGYGGNRGW